MTDYFKMMENGTAAQAALLMKNIERRDYEDKTLRELYEIFVDYSNALQNEIWMKNPEKMEIITFSAEACNALYAMMWHCEKLQKIEDSKRRKQDAKKMVKEMARD